MQKEEASHQIQALCELNDAAHTARGRASKGIARAAPRSNHPRPAEPTSRPLRRKLEHGGVTIVPVLPVNRRVGTVFLFSLAATPGCSLELASSRLRSCVFLRWRVRSCCPSTSRSTVGALFECASPLLSFSLAGAVVSTLRHAHQALQAHTVG